MAKSKRIINTVNKDNVVRGFTSRQIPDGNIHTMPCFGPEHTESVDCWCEPELAGDYEQHNGVKHYLHREIQ